MRSARAFLSSCVLFAVGHAIRSINEDAQSLTIDEQVQDTIVSDLSNAMFLNSSTTGIWFDTELVNCPGVKTIATIDGPIDARVESGGEVARVTISGKTTQTIASGETEATIDGKIQNCPRALKWTLGCDLPLSVSKIEEPCKPLVITLSKVGIPLGSLTWPGLNCPLIPGETITTPGPIEVQLFDLGSLQRLPGFGSALDTSSISATVQVKRKADQLEVLCMSASSTKSKKQQ